MKDWFGYFFGKGTEVEFTNFGIAHFAPILAAVCLIVLIFLLRERLCAAGERNRCYATS